MAKLPGKAAATTKAAAPVGSVRNPLPPLTDGDGEVPASALEFVPLPESGETVNALWYGPGGTGKTTAVATMANLGQVLFVNAESGIKRRPLERLGVKVDNIRIFPKPGQLLTFDLLEELFWQIAGDLQQDPASWAGTAWDSVTEIHKKLLEDEAKRGYEKALSLNKDRDRFFIDRGDYGTMAEQVRLLLRRFRDLPCHFSMTALERREQDEEDGTVTYMPAVTPALQADLIGYMDVVCHTSVREVGGEDEYQGLLRPSGKYRGKDRFGATPRRLIDPTFIRILDYIEDRIDADSDPVMQAGRKRRAAQEAEEAKDKEETN